MVVRTQDGVHKVLLIRDPYRNWGLPKGHLENEEPASEAALREVREETGLQGVTLGPDLGAIDWYFRLDGVLVHKFCHFYLMASPEGTAIPEVEEGITECRWVPVEEAVRVVTYDNAREVIRSAKDRLRDPSEGFPPWE